MSAVLPASSVTPGSPPLAAAQRLNWYALYTCSRHEKRVAAQIQQRAIEFYLPLYESVRRWKDRRVKLQLPLFPGYIFVYMTLQQRFEVLNLPGAVRFVAFNGCPAALSEVELLRLRNGLDQGLCAQPHPYLKIGRRVRVRSGPLAGLEGLLVRKKERYRLVLSIDLIMRSVAVEVDGADVEALD